MSTGGGWAGVGDAHRVDQHRPLGAGLEGGQLGLHEIKQAGSWSGWLGGLLGSAGQVSD